MSQNISCLRCSRRFTCIKFTVFDSLAWSEEEISILAIKAEELSKDCSYFKERNKETKSLQTPGAAKTDPGARNFDSPHGHRIAGGYYHRGRIPW